MLGRLVAQVNALEQTVTLLCSHRHDGRGYIVTPLGASLQIIQTVRDDDDEKLDDVDDGPSVASLN